jgi:Flp pilus assembly protein protease CpaA
VAFAALLLYAAVIDIKTLIIPDALYAAMCALDIIHIFVARLTPLNAIEGLFAAGLPFLIIACIKKENIGGGDVKLFGLVGLFLGFNGAVFMVMLTCLIFICVEILLKMLGKIKAGSRVAIAPYIATGGIITCLIILLGG